MACTILRSNHHNKAFHALGLFSLLLLIQNGGATEFKVGGSAGWTIPDPYVLHYNQWAEMNRFQIGDSLLFVYSAANDSVLHVTKDDYTNCNTATPIESFSGGNTVYKFSQSGPYYFVSGTEENCLKNEKMAVVVLADRSNQSVSPPPSESTGIIPSPAPAGEESPSPPPSGSVEIIPSPAPTTESSHPPSGASSIFMSFIISIGAFVGSFLFLVF